MSELMNHQRTSQAIRGRFLATVSALALLGFMGINGTAKASDNDTDRPTVWIELGGQLDRLEVGQERLAPPFFTSISAAGFTSPLILERPPLYSIDENGKISFQPSNSGWLFSASIRYGRSSANAYRHQQTDNPPVGFGAANPSQARFRYAETTASDTEIHEIFDFMAGKDMGLGALGINGTSVLSGGLRFAQFRSESGLAVHSDPDYTNPNTVSSIVGPKYLHNFSAKAGNKTSFTGIGPAISWDASTPLIGQMRDEQLTFDWDVNGGILFGRQKSRGSHQTNGKLTTGVLNLPPLFYYHTTHYTHSASHNRSQRVTVPNLGAMAGFSLRYANAKVSFGYRIDEFFGATDGGIDVRKSYNFGLSGPFVNISVGLGG